MVLENINDRKVLFKIYKHFCENVICVTYSVFVTFVYQCKLV
jgi:hypothetical protein